MLSPRPQPVHLRCASDGKAFIGKGKVQFCSTSVFFLADLVDSLFRYFIWIITLSLLLASACKSASFKNNDFLLSYKQQTNLWMKPPHNSAGKDSIVKKRPLLNQSDCRIWGILLLANWEKKRTSGSITWWRFHNRI